ncbi:MAG: hypothetical protein GY804_06710 [Alphaproteobacteria bacterium]|nr:hypothetical protein [Alphaproteobacteria bacterium]
MGPLWWTSHTIFNVNPSYSYFDARPSKRISTIFHELTHIYGAKDNAEWWNNSHVLDDILEWSWYIFAYDTVKMKVIEEKGKDSCPKPEWPDNQ